MYDMEEYEEQSEPQIEAPINLLPDLSLWGIEEVDKGICYDTAENRALLRENKSKWIEVYTKDGHSTNLIQALTPEMRAARVLVNKAVILTDPKDPDSDYLTGFNLLIEVKADDAVPAWVLGATRRWEEVEKEREKRGDAGKLYRPFLVGPPGRCRATRVDGHRCQNWHSGYADHDGMCRTHFTIKANAEDNYGPNVVQRAKNRIFQATLKAAEVLEELADSATSEDTKLRAANSILDRGGLRGAYEIEQNITVTGKPAAEIVQERLAKMALAAAPTTPEDTEGEVIEAELVEIEVKTDDEQ